MFRPASLFLSLILCLALSSTAFADISARLPETPAGPGGPNTPETPIDPDDPLLDPCPTDAIDGHSFSMRFDSGERTTFRGSDALYDEARGIWYMEFRVGDGGAFGRVTLACARNPNYDETLASSGTPDIFYDWGWTRPVDGSLGRNTEQRLNNAAIVSSRADATACYSCGVIRDFEGCFPPGVEIALDADGTTKKVEDIAVGDKLWNPVLKTQVAVERVIEGPEVLPIIAVEFSSNLVRMTQGHPVKTKSGVKAAKSLTLEDKVLGSDGEYHSITSLKALPLRENQRVINFVMASGSAESDARMILADGLVTGDYVLQTEIAGQ